MMPLEDLLQSCAVWHTAPASEMTVEAAHFSFSSGRAKVQRGGWMS